MAPLLAMERLETEVSRCAVLWASGSVHVSTQYILPHLLSTHQDNVHNFTSKIFNALSSFSFVNYFPIHSCVLPCPSCVSSLHLFIVLHCQTARANVTKT